MSPSGQASTDDDRGLQWATIEDFKLGIVSNTSLSAQNAGVPLGNATGSLPAPLGAAQEVGTINCIALPSGGLAPLPSAAFDIPPAFPLTLVPSSVTTGLFVVGPLALDAHLGPVGAIMSDCIIDGIDSATPKLSSRNYQINVQYVDASGTVYDAENIFDGTDTSTSDGIMTMTGGLTMANPTPTLLGYPCWALSFWFLAGGPTSVIYEGQPFTILWPDPTAPGTGGAIPLLLQDSYACQTLTHQNRIVNLQMQLFAWSDDNHTIDNNETFNYTDPPNGIAIGVQNEVFVQEHPTGAGAWGSVSAGELFVVKNSGGGYVLSGDLNSPTVTFLGGVVPTRGVMSNNEPTPIGICYAVGGRGVWSWNGNSTSQKISTQLDDNFYVIPGFAEKLVFPSPSVQIVPWGEWIVVSNSFLFDTANGGWWRLGGSPDVGGANVLLPWIWYGTGWDGDTLYAAEYTPTTTRMCSAYKRSIPNPTYTWLSHPIPESINRNLIIEEVVVRAQGKGTVQLTLTGISGTISISSPTLCTVDDEFQSQVFRFKPGLSPDGGPMVAQDVTISISSIGTAVTGPVAPVVYSVAVGYTSQNPSSPT